MVLNITLASSDTFNQIVSEEKNTVTSADRKMISIKGFFNMGKRIFNMKVSPPIIKTFKVAFSKG
jgi:hypothetical protein